MLKKLWLLIALLLLPVGAEAQEVARGYFAVPDCGQIFGPAHLRVVCLQLENAGGRVVGSQYQWDRVLGWVLYSGGSGSGGSQHKVNSIDVLDNDPINLTDTASIVWANPSAGNVTATISLQSGSGLQISSGLSFRRDCTDQQVQKWTSATSSWGCANDVTAGAPVWDTIGSPTGNQALSMAARTSTWTWGNATGSGTNMLTLTDTASNSGTGFLASLSTATGSAAKPLRVTAQGTANGVEMTTAGALQPIGTGTIITAFSSLTGVATNAQLPTTITGRTLDNSNTVTFLDSLFTLQDNVDPTKQIKFELSDHTTGLTRTYTLPDASTGLLGHSTFTGSHAATLRRTAASTYSACRDNFAASVDPALTDDSAANYCIGSVQVNTTASPRTVWLATNVSVGAAVWLPLGTTTEVDTLALVCARGCSFTGANSFATGMHIGLSATSGGRLYEDPSLGFIFTCVVGGVENACDWIRKLNAGKKFEIQNSSGAGIFTVTESTGAITNAILNAESSGNTITLPFEDWSEAAACNNATASLIFNSPTANAPGATCEGTNTRHATADFDDTTDEFFDHAWRLPTGFTGALDFIIRWKGAATSGAVGWCVQIIRVALSAVSDPALPAQAAGNCVSSTADGTTLEETEATISGVTCTSCVATDRVNIRISRDANGSAVTDSFVGDAKMVGFTKRYRRAM